MNPFDALTVPLEGRSLVEASAGTGKTYSITTLALRLILERDVGIDQIAVVTFTEAATAEVRQRIRHRLRVAASGADPDLPAILARVDDPARSLADARLAAALARIDEAPIFTLHGFCHRVLAESAFESGSRFDAELVSDLSAVREDVLVDFVTHTLASLADDDVLLLRKLGLRPRALAALVARAADPDLAVRPPVVPVDDLAASGEHFAVARQRAAEAWVRGEVEGLLSRSSALSNYRAGWVEGWCDRVDGYFAQDPRNAPPLDDELFARFDPRQLAQKLKKNARHPPTHAFFDAVAVLRDAAEARLHAGERRLLRLQHDLIAFARDELPRRKRRRGWWSFDDLLRELRAALLRPGGERLARLVRSRYPVALVDEFQDTDPVQYDVVRRIWPAEDALSLYIGDPKQAIYAFRGADVFAYLRAREALGPEARRTMTTNWRSDPRLLRAIEVIMTRHPRPFLVPEIDFVPVAPRPDATDRLQGPGDRRAALEVLFVPREAGDEVCRPEQRDALVGAVAAEVIDLFDATIDGAPVRADDIAILTRTNRQAFAVQHALRQLGVPTVVLGDQSVFESPVATELSAVLGALLEPADTSRLRAALTTELIGVSAAELRAMDDDDGSTWGRWLDRFRELGARWRSRGFIAAFRRLVLGGGLVERAVQRVDGERRFTDLMHLAELLHGAERSLHLGPAGLLQWLASQRQLGPRGEDAQIRLESDRGAVVITTMHRSKGLEYPIVLVPFAWRGNELFSDDQRLPTFHDPNAGHRPTLDLEARPESLELARREQLAESLRLLYVAVTRAKHRCTVVWGALDRAWGSSALGYLLHPPAMNGSLDDMAADIGARDDPRLRAELAALTLASDGAIAVRDLDLDPTPSPRPPPSTRGAIAARSLQRPVPPGLSLASFTQLTRNAHGGHEAKDRDLGVEDVPGRSLEGEPITLRDFPRGAKAGNFFHAVLEHLDFERPPAEQTDLVDRQLDHYAFPREHRDLVVQALTEVLATRLPDGRGRTLRLQQVPRARRLDELEFHVPVGSARADLVPRGTQLSLGLAPAGGVARPGVPIGRLTARKLAEVFAAHPSPALDPGYAARVERLDFIPHRGFLRGFIDLVFEHRGRHYLVDYKTNHLGDHRRDYHPDALAQAMSRGHYYLQYHLYALALHRWLRRRKRGYRYDRHFGGVHYLFLKGTSPSSHDGIFFEKPPERRLEALGELLDRPPRYGDEREEPA